MARRGDGGDGEQGVRAEGVGPREVEQRDAVRGAGHEVRAGRGPNQRGDREVGFRFVLDQAEGG